MNAAFPRALPSLLNAAKRRTNVVTKRHMGSHGGPPPTGWEAKVREVLPHDHQIVLATLGFYTTIFMLFKLKPSKKVEEAESAPASSSSTAIPSILDDEFDEWAKVPGNLAKWEKSLETFGN